jgi:non-ribosomal peptide synthetase component E (peptide arylation enzyme)
MKARLFELIEAYANMAPASLAAVCNGSAVTYAELRALLETMSDELRGQGVLPGHVIATAIADGLQNWVSTLAMMHLRGGSVFDERGGRVAGPYPRFRDVTG